MGAVGKAADYINSGVEMENSENQLVQELLKRIERLEVQVKELQDQLKRIKSLP